MQSIWNEPYKIGLKHKHAGGNLINNDIFFSKDSSKISLAISNSKSSIVLLSNFDGNKFLEY